MKTTLKINADSIFALDKLLSNVYNIGFSLGLSGKTKEAKVLLSISYELSNKFNSKSRNIVLKQSLFDSKKKYSIGLKFHEAWALEQIIYASLDNVNNDYAKTLLKKIADDLNQKTV